MSTSPLSRVGLPASDDAAPATGNRKAVLGIAGLLTVGLALVASLVLGGGGDDLEDLGTAPAAAAAEPTATASASPSAEALRFPDDATARDGRDPFAPLYEETRGAVAAAPVAPAPEAAVPPPPPAPPAPAAAPAMPAVVDGPGSGTPAAQPSTSSGVPMMALLRTEGSDPSRTAVFTVGGAEVPVAVGESFGPAGSLLLLSLQQGPATGGWTAVVQAGQGEPFDVVSGVPVAIP